MAVQPSSCSSRRIVATLLTALLALSAPALLAVASAQDLPPPGQAKPKPKPKPPRQGGGGGQSGPAAPASPALLLSADMPCTVTIDGLERHQLSGTTPKRVNVSIGQHLLSAVSNDGRLKWEQIVETKGAGQQVVVQIKLSDAAGTSPEEFDAAAAKAWLAISDVKVAGQFVSSVLNKSFGFHDKGLSTAIYTAHEYLKRELEEFKKYTASDPTRKRVLDDFTRLGETAAKYVELMGQAITTAQSQNSFLGEANNLYAQARALEPTMTIPDDVLVEMKKSQAFMAALPVDKRGRLGVANDPRDVRLGADYYHSTPNMLAVVTKDGLADDLGFKSGDRILSVNGQAVPSIWDFKLALRANAGKKLNVLVEREGKQRSVDAKVPSQLP